jgi:hypothetical protein
LEKQITADLNVDKVYSENANLANYKEKNPQYSYKEKKQIELSFIREFYPQIKDLKLI